MLAGRLPARPEIVVHLLKTLVIHMAKIERILGGAGCGKTACLMGIMDEHLRLGHCSPFTTGFVTFTRAARREASERAAAAHGLSPEDLEQDGWFRTVHSICY